MRWSSFKGCGINNCVLASLVYIHFQFVIYMFLLCDCVFCFQLLYFSSKNPLKMCKIPLPSEFYLIHTFVISILLLFLLNRTTIKELLKSTIKKYLSVLNSSYENLEIFM